MLEHLPRDAKASFEDKKVEDNFNKLLKECAYNSLKKEITSKFGEYWRSLLDTPEFISKFPILEELNNKIEAKHNTDYIFVTINPRPNISLDDFKKIVFKSLSKNWLTKYLMVFEQRGIDDSEIGKGFHSHILIYRKGKKFNEIKREFQSSFRKVCDSDNPAVLNFRMCKDEDLDKRIKYITGIKKVYDDNMKDIKQQYDILFRQKNNLEPYYSLGFATS